jgi:hypothetical protein
MTQGIDAERTDELPGLEAATASRYARAGLANVSREYPNHPGHLLTGPDDLAPPSTLHPIFFGSYDWHSSVHQHWMLVRLLRQVPGLPEGDAIREVFDARFTEAAVETEAAYLRHPLRRAWERPYGWAWLLTLTAELAGWSAAADGGVRTSAPVAATSRDAARWASALAPLTEVVRGRCLEWLTSTTYPQRSGTHANSAFACVLLHDVAASLGDDELEAAIRAAAVRWYTGDGGYPAWLEPSASDFLSPVLTELDLLRRLEPARTFPDVLQQLLPDPGSLLEPAVVSDRSDPHTVHLDGLNLSRAWCWLGIAHALPAGHDGSAIALDAARRHTAASLPAVLSGEYVGEHWLPTFALYLLDVAETATDPIGW